MPVIVAWIGSMLLSVIGRMAISALISVGIGFAATHLAASTGLDAVIAGAFSHAGPLYDYIGFFNIGTAITIVLSAAAGRQITEAAHAYLTANPSPKLKGSV
ncbi:MAG: hypothetical protein ACYCZD_01885 [Rhodanobacter sp.]